MVCFLHWRVCQISWALRSNVKESQLYTVHTIHTITCHFALPQTAALTTYRRLWPGLIFVIIYICSSVFVGLLFVPLNACCPALSLVCFSCITCIIFIDDCPIWFINSSTDNKSQAAAGDRVRLLLSFTTAAHCLLPCYFSQLNNQPCFCIIV